MQANVIASLQFFRSQFIHFTHQSCAPDGIDASCSAVCRRADTARELTATRAWDERGRQIRCDCLRAIGNSESSEWFGALDAAFQQAVLGSSRVVVLPTGKSLFHRGDPS